LRFFRLSALQNREFHKVAFPKLKFWESLHYLMILPVCGMRIPRIPSGTRRFNGLPTEYWAFDPCPANFYATYRIPCLFLLSVVFWNFTENTVITGNTNIEHDPAVTAAFYAKNGFISNMAMNNRTVSIRKDIWI
jgi:hypothetical protein